jgi:hypothetical protein
MGINVDQQRELEQYVHDHVSFLSFSKDSEDIHKCRLTYERSPMWGLYARSNRGACLVLDEQRFLQENNLLNSGIWYKSNFMTYKDVISERIEDIRIPSIEQYVKQNYDFLFFQKQLCWDFENEYRYVFIDQTSFSIEDSIIGVILGRRFENIQQLRDLYLHSNKCRLTLNNPYYWAVQEQHNGRACISTYYHPMIDKFFPQDLNYNEAD